MGYEQRVSDHRKASTQANNSPAAALADMCHYDIIVKTCVESIGFYKKLGEI
jgi:hypothetical protein